jgi:hypothetical protein
MESIEQLRQLIREQQHQIEEEQRQREEAESRALEEQRQREKAENRALEIQHQLEESKEITRPQTLKQYLEACHSLSLAIQVVTKSSFVTRGNAADPTGRIYPRQIIPWNDFAARQKKIWNNFSSGDFPSLPAFPSQHQLKYVESLLEPISSEIGLREFERDTVEIAVKKLVDKVYVDPQLRSLLGLRGTVTFESHTNLGTTDDNLASAQHMSLSGAGDGTAVALALKAPAAPKTHHKARGKGNRADQFCIYRTMDSQNYPVLAIEYKAPHKLSVEQVGTGLESEIQPDRDIINRDGQGFAFPAKSIAAAVVTQLFSYMIGKGIQYGYVCTGQAFAFLHISADPSIVQFSVCVPNLDVVGDDESRLHRTAVAQVFAFILQALQAHPPPESWHDEAKKLGIWPVEHDDILAKIPESARKRKEPSASSYEPLRATKTFSRSPVQTRSCRQMDANVVRPESDDDEDPPSPTPNPSRTGRKVVPSTGVGGEKRGRGQGEQGQATNSNKQSRPLCTQSGEQGRGRGEHGQVVKPNIESRPFCTQKCLLGLAYGGPMDENCPNSDYHGQGHIDRLKFLHLIRDQLATDRGPDADCAPLYQHGARGSLFKVRLSTHGYTLVAKGVGGLDRACLQHENEMYNRLRAIQGKYVPVCLGSIDLVLPCHCGGGVYPHFMFLSWAGRPLHECGDLVNKVGVVKMFTTIFKAIHKLRILHRDAEPRNMLYDTNSGNLMVIDFERSESLSRQPSSSKSRIRKDNPNVSQKQWEGDFASELGSAIKKVSMCIANLPSRAVARV